MSVGDWAQSIIGVAGILATLLVAGLVLRLERRDRQGEKIAERQQAAVSADRQRAEDGEKEKRTARREQHKEDYSAVNRALAVLNRVFEAVETKPLTEEEFQDSGIEEAMELVHEISNRIPGLDKPLSNVWIAAVNVTRDAFPSAADFQYAALSTEGQVDRQQHLMLEAVQSGVNQSRSGIQGLHAVRRAREALASEWGDS